MAIISTNMTTNEYDSNNKSFQQGHIGMKITFGLDENFNEIMAEASERVQDLLKSIPPEKHFSRF